MLAIFSARPVRQHMSAAGREDSSDATAILAHSKPTRDDPGDSFQKRGRSLVSISFGQKVTPRKLKGWQFSKAVMIHGAHMYCIEIVYVYIVCILHNHLCICAYKYMETARKR